jgi:hypothetical protein
MYLTVKYRREVLYPERPYARRINHTDHEKEIHDLSTQQKDPESILVNFESLLFIDSYDFISVVV